MTKESTKLHEIILACVKCNGSRFIETETVAVCTHCGHEYDKTKEEAAGL